MSVSWRSLGAPFDLKTWAPRKEIIRQLVLIKRLIKRRRHITASSLNEKMTESALAPFPESCKESPGDSGESLWRANAR